MFRQVFFGAENQGNHQNLEKSLLSYKCGLIFIGLKPFFFWKVCEVEPHKCPSHHSTLPKDQSMKFSWKNVENWGSWKWQIFWVSHFEFFPSQWNLVHIYRIARIFRHFDGYPGFQPQTFFLIVST